MLPTAMKASQYGWLGKSSVPCVVAYTLSIGARTKKAATAMASVTAPVFQSKRRIATFWPVGLRSAPNSSMASSLISLKAWMP